MAFAGPLRRSLKVLNALDVRKRHRSVVFVRIAHPLRGACYLMLNKDGGETVESDLRYNTVRMVYGKY